jgi:hypothetical protein
MSSRHPKALKWERTLKGVFDRIDAELEREYGERYPLHPVRAETGRTANPEHDGLFNLGAVFSAGYGSQHGPGYVVRLRVATLSTVPKAVLEEMEEFVAERLRTELPKAFPNRELKITRDGPLFKIHGDLSLSHV